MELNSVEYVNIHLDLGFTCSFNLIYSSPIEHSTMCWPCSFVMSSPSCPLCWHWSTASPQIKRHRESFCEHAVSADNTNQLVPDSPCLALSTPASSSPHFAGPLYSLVWCKNHYNVMVPHPCKTTGKMCGRKQMWCLRMNFFLRIMIQGLTRPQTVCRKCKAISRQPKAPSHLAKHRSTVLNKYKITLSLGFST